MNATAPNETDLADAREDGAGYQRDGLGMGCNPYRGKGDALESAWDAGYLDAESEGPTISEILDASDDDEGEVIASSPAVPEPTWSVEHKPGAARPWRLYMTTDAGRTLVASYSTERKAEAGWSAYSGN